MAKRKKKSTETETCSIADLVVQEPEVVDFRQELEEQQSKATTEIELLNKYNELNKRILLLARIEALLPGLDATQERIAALEKRVEMLMKEREETHRELLKTVPVGTPVDDCWEQGMTHRNIGMEAEDVRRTRAETRTG